jgi:tetratricopeptide (TPR) repeat protein
VGAPTLTSERDREVLRSFARRIDPSDAGAHNNLGVLYYRKGLYEEAVEAFTRALELDPKMQVAQRNLEVAYFGTGYYDRRVAELRERLRMAADEREARWELGRAYALLGRLSEAVAEFTELLRHHPNDLGAIIQLGLAEKASGDLETAQRWFERALALDPASSVTHFYVGEVLYNRGLNDEALAALTRAIERNPDNPDAHYLMGFVLGDMGRHEEAREATKRAIRLNPTLSRAQANLTLEATATRRDGAVSPPGASDRMLIAEDGQLAHFGLGLAFRQKGYYAEALREYQLALDRGEDASLVRQAMAEVHLLRKDVAAAVSMYDQLLIDQPESPKLWNERGVRHRAQQPGCRHVSCGRHGGGGRGVRAGVGGGADVREGAAQSGAAPVQGEAAARELGGISRGIDSSTGAARRVERRRARAGGVEEIRGRAQRLCPGDAESADLRRGALQPELRPVEPRGLR